MTNFGYLLKNNLKSFNIKKNDKIKIKYLENLNTKKFFIVEGLVMSLKKNKTILKLKKKIGNFFYFMSLKLDSPLILEVCKI